MNRSCLGDLARLVDDALSRILSLCEPVDLLHIEQTCKYFRMLVADREIWHAVLLRLSRACSPAILPYQNREETDFRHVALSSVRGFKNWTSENPKPLWCLPLNLPHAERILSDLHLLPGGKFLLYSLDNAFYCFDVDGGINIAKHPNHFSEVIQCAYEMQPGGDTIDIFIVSMSGGTMVSAHFETINLNLKTGQCILTNELSIEWQNLYRTSGGEYIMLREPTLGNTHIMIPYIAGDFVDSKSRGALIIDRAARNSSIALFSLHNCDKTYDECELPVGYANGHLLYISGSNSHSPAIHAVPLNQFTELWNDHDDDATSKLIRRDIQPHHVVSSGHIKLSTPNLSSRMALVTHRSNWLDLEKARLTDPSVTRLSLIDITFVLKTDESNPHQYSYLIAQIQFAERKRDLDNSGPSVTFIHSETSAMLNSEGLSNHWPCRTGRLVGITKAPQKVQAIQVHTGSTRALKHLEPRIVRDTVFEYYSSVVLHSSRLRDLRTREPVQGTSEFVIEGYDWPL